MTVQMDTNPPKLYNFLIIIFILTIPYGYFGFNLLSTDTNPLSMYLLPAVLILIALRISKIWDIELTMIIILSILSLSTLHTITGPFNGRQAIVRIAGYVVGFSYFILSARNFKSNLNVEYLIAIAHYPLLLIGAFQIITVLTGAFIDINTTIRTIFVSSPAIVLPLRISLLSSEPSFVAFQIPLLLYIYYRSEMWISLGTWIIILLFTRSINVYLTLFVFFTGMVLYHVINGINKKQIGGALAVLCILTLFVFTTPYLNSRLDSITQDVSVLIRFNYILSLFPMVIEYPLGIGVGQYGTYALEIFNKYNLSIMTSDVQSSLQSKTLDPWSLILGMIAEGGIIIIPFVTLFLTRLFQICKQTAIDSAVFLSSTYLIFQTYPPATPYVWIVLGLVWYENTKEKQK
jgi:hypothetical protein